MSKIEVKKPNEAELQALGVHSWSPWSCEVSTFDWQYDAEEICYIQQGQVSVQTDDGEVSFGPGDLVTFPKGLKCVWKVVKPVRKVYTFR